jgi:pimeloyl-ACP methyl ester carboxylesterase
MLDDMTRAPDAIVDGIERQAERFESPCGEGRMVWRAWGAGRPVVLFHGAHGSWTHWVRNVDVLRRRYRVLSPDLPGHGESDLPARTDDVRSFAEAIADGLRLSSEHGPFDLLGFSMGGVIAAHLAAIAPELVRRLIVIDSGGLGTPPGSIVGTRVRGLEGRALREAHRTNLLGLMLHAEDSVDDLALYVQARNVPRTRVQPAPLVMPDKLLQALPHVHAQIDLIWGEHDRAHPDPELQASVVRRFQPDATLHVVAGAGHWVMYERAEAFNGLVLDLLDQPLRT